MALVKFVAAGAVLLLLFACDHGVEWSDNDYEALWIDDPGCLQLVRKLGDGASIGRTGCGLTAVGANPNFVVARNGTTTAMYYVIDRSRDSRYLNASDITQGPYSEAEFRAQQAKIGLPEPNIALRSR